MKTTAQRIETADTIELVPQILRLKKILVPTDFSETSKKAVQYALRFSEQLGCDIVSTALLSASCAQLPAQFSSSAKKSTSTFRPIRGAL